MKIFVAAVLLLQVVSVSAEEVAFPSTQADIVKQLSKPTYAKTRGFGATRGYGSRGVGGVVADKPKLKVAANILFEVNASQLKDDSKPLLNEFGKAFSENLSGAVFNVVGNTDSDGNDDYNAELGFRRAQAVVDYLVAIYGVERASFRVQSEGESSPIAENVSAQGRARNRRVEFVRLD